jgi:uncharacterized protein
LGNKKLKINKKYLWFLVFLIPIIFFIMTQEKERKIISINGNSFNVEIASTKIEKAMGLMNREKLGEEEGMLFVYQKEGIYSFWMKNMRFPIDIIWIDKGKRIVGIEKNAPPCLKENCPRHKPSREIMYVLELNSGTTEKLEIKKGDKISFQQHEEKF